MSARLIIELLHALISGTDVHKKTNLLIDHSDRGSQYTSEKFEKLATENGILLSMSSTSNCYDNAVAESFHTLKIEHVYQERFATREEAVRLQEATNKAIRYSPSKGDIMLTTINVDKAENLQ